MRRITAWLATLPSTNARITVTLGCVIATAIAYCIAWKSPDGGWEAWLTFLAAMSGLDVTQFYAKRKTDRPPGSSSGTNGPSETTS